MRLLQKVKTNTVIHGFKGKYNMKKIFLFFIILVQVINALEISDIEDLDKACSKGEAEACFKIGNFYHPKAIAKNNKEAAIYYHKACDMNHGKACNNLGNLYKNGHGVQQDYQMALELFAKACEIEDSMEKGCTNKEKLIELMKDLNETKVNSFS